jgi:type VI protein secretion system component Hcp
MTDVIGRRLRATGIAVLAVAGAALAVAVLQPVQAAPVPAAQASCPPPVDPRPVAANTASYARIDGIPGDAAGAHVAGQIALTSIRSGLIAGLSGLCGNGGGVPAFDPFIVEKRVDRASVVLLARAATGAHIANARLSVWTETGTPRQFLTYDLADVTVLSVRTVQRNDSLTEEVALGFRRITWSFVTRNADGTNGATIQACYDLARRATC